LPIIAYFLHIPVPFSLFEEMKLSFIGQQGLK
jgi:hypothetical protein